MCLQTEQIQNVFCEKGLSSSFGFSTAEALLTSAANNQPWASLYCILFAYQLWDACLLWIRLCHPCQCCVVSQSVVLYLCWVQGGVVDPACSWPRWWWWPPCHRAWLYGPSPPSCWRLGWGGARTSPHWAPGRWTEGYNSPQLIFTLCVHEILRDEKRIESVDIKGKCVIISQR